MNEDRRNANGKTSRRQWVNRFKVVNLDDLNLTYRLLRIEGLPENEHLPKNLNQLSKAVSYEIRSPVSVVHRGDDSYLAIAGDAPLPELQQQLMPHVATLSPGETLYPLQLSDLDGMTRAIARDFVRFALGGPLMQDKELWGRGRGFHSKKPANAERSNDVVDVYPGFKWSVVVTPEGEIFLAVDVTSRYVERGWFVERLDRKDPADYRFRHFLYHYGHDWYSVQLWSLTGRSISDQLFVPTGSSESIDVFSYTRNAWKRTPPSWIQGLDPESPAILYRYPGSELERYGALALCKLALSTDHPDVSRLHRKAALEPQIRLESTIGIVEKYFQSATLDGYPIEVASTPLEIERKVFPIPAQRLGNDYVLSVGTGPSLDKRIRVSPQQLGRKRKQMVMDPQIGPLETSPFDAQYIFLPRSMPREINEDYQRRFVKAMGRISGQSDYSLRRVLYDDANAVSLYRQTQAIKREINTQGISRGYALLILPEGADPDLHNFIKKELWPNLQFQCALASKIRSHYATRNENGTSKFAPAPKRRRDLDNYVQGCALGMMVVNRKWLWALEATLHCDAYVGIDVLNGVAGFTFIYDRGRHMIFRDYPSKQPERLTAPQMRKILVDGLSEDLSRLALRPRTLVFHRDGRTYGSELKGIDSGIKDLTTQIGDVLPKDIKVGVVEIPKSTTDNTRIYEGYSLGRVENPAIGSHEAGRFGSYEGTVCTTGWPFQLPGTAKPLRAVLVKGEDHFMMENILEDIFALSQLVFTAPNRCMRLPATIKVANDFLEPIASAADEDLALYGEEETYLVDTEESDVEVTEPVR